MSEAQPAGDAIGTSDESVPVPNAKRGLRAPWTSETAPRQSPTTNALRQAKEARAILAAATPAAALRLIQRATDPSLTEDQRHRADLAILAKGGVPDLTAVALSVDVDGAENATEDERRTIFGNLLAQLRAAAAAPAPPALPDVTIAPATSAGESDPATTAATTATKP